GVELTYGELDARANQVAWWLIDQGVGVEDRVAVLLPRSVELVVALLGVSKAGGVYVPLDTIYPIERIMFMLADAAPAAVITHTSMADALSDAGIPLVLVDSPRCVVEPDIGGLYPAVAPHPDNLAYVIYTSGSTGTPKGVAISHRSLVNYLVWACEAYGGVRGTSLVHSSISFDLTVTSLFAPLISGGCVEVIDFRDEHEVDIGPFSFVKSTPSHLPFFPASSKELSRTEQLVLGGELLLSSVLNEWRAKHPRVTVINEYGPTETTVGCAEFRVAPADELPLGAVPAGTPIANMRVFVLDGWLRPVPVGVAGELYVGGVGVAGSVPRGRCSAGRA
uniref:AMP-binding protein n=1 Tax=Nocardia brasiliensis TaxID=37326 RepID=UPI002454BF9C